MSKALGDTPEKVATMKEDTKGTVQKGNHMSKVGGSTPEKVPTMNEDTKRTLLMAAATLASGTMSSMQTSEWSDQMPGVVEAAFGLLLREYKKLP